MDAMQRFFGSTPRGPSAPTAARRGKEAAVSEGADPTTVGSACEKLHDTSELIGKREQHLLRQISEEVESAREHAGHGRQREALLAMKKKKILEKELEQLVANKLTLFQEEQTLRALKFNSLVMDAHSAGMQAIQREIKKVNGVEGVEKVQDELDDLLADASDVLGAGNRTMGEAASLDDDELLEELERMELQDLTEQLTETSAGSSQEPVFAQVPKETPAQIRAREKEREERELLAELQGLQSSMAMKVETPMPMPMMAAVC